MKQLLLLGALALTPLLNISNGHGGTYRGPGDIPPPGGGGGGGNGGPRTPGPSGPSNPGSGGPSTPAPGAPTSPGSPGGSGGPSTNGPNGGAPDLTIWQFWWGLNKDPYLNLRAKIHARGVLTGSDEYFMGLGETRSRNNMIPSEQSIRETVVPALLHALGTEKQNDILTGAMIALAKIGDAKDIEGDSQFERVFTQFLSNSVQEVRETAAIALGILGNPASLETLRNLALDTTAGRELVQSHEVDYRTRSFAVYGMGLVGCGASDGDRQGVVRTLHQILEGDRQSTRDVKVAAMLAMGLVPLDTLDAPVIEGREVDPSLSRRHQIEYVLELLQTNHREPHHLVRAHAPRTLVQLVTGTLDLTDVQRTLFVPASTEWREKVGGILADMISSGGRSLSTELRQSATLALGRLGDAGMSELSKSVRHSLLRASGNSDQQTKWFAMVALAQSNSIPARDDAPWAGLREVQDELVRKLVRGPSRGKTWAALALGVMGHNQAQFGASPSTAVNIGLRDTLSRITSPQDVGAYALGSALRGDLDAKALIYEKLQSLGDDGARGDMAVALGLLGAREHIDDIQRIVREAKYRPELLKQAAIALGLLGDNETVPLLVSMLSDAQSLASQASIATALGFIGDARSIKPLVAMLEDTEQTALARAFAAVALGGVADKEALPWNAKLSCDLQYRASTVTLIGQGTGLLDLL